MELAQLRATTTPSPQTNRYIQEATKEYISGLPMASVAMSRAALEQGLKERLGRQGDGIYYEFRALVDDARRCNILSNTGTHAARNLAKVCNELLHEKPIQDDAAAFKILAEIRSLLEEVYSAEGGY